MYPFFRGRSIDDLLIFVERSVTLSCDYQLVIVRKGFKSLQEDVQPLVFADQAEKEQILHAGFEPKHALGLLAGQFIPEVGIQRMENNLGRKIRSPSAQVFCYCIA